MTEDHVAAEHVRSVQRPSGLSVVAVVAGIVLGLLLLSALVSAAFSLVGLLIPLLLIGGGLKLVLDDHRVWGIGAAGLGALMLASHLPLLILLTGAALIGWTLARR